MVAPATDCPTCQAVSGGGRIRVTNDSSMNLLLGLKPQRQSWTWIRRHAIEMGFAETIEFCDQQLKSIDLAIEELERTRVEMGWSDGQPQRSHT